MSVATTPAPAPEELPIVDSFTVAAQIRTITTDTTARLTVALPEATTITPAVLVPALLTLGQRVLQEHRLTDRQLPEVGATAVERVATAPTSARTTGFTVRVTNDLTNRQSNTSLDSDLLDNDNGVLLIAATLLAGAEHLLEADGSATHRPHSGPAHASASS